MFAKESEKSRTPTGLNNAGKWLLSVSIFALLVMLLAVLGFRLQLFLFPVALVLLGLSLFIAALAFLCSLFFGLKRTASQQ